MSHDIFFGDCKNLVTFFHYGKNFKTYSLRAKTSQLIALLCAQLHVTSMPTRNILYRLCVNFFKWIWNWNCDFVQRFSISHKWYFGMCITCSYTAARPASKSQKFHMQKCRFLMVTTLFCWRISAVEVLLLGADVILYCMVCLFIVTASIVKALKCEYANNFKLM